MMCGIDRRNLKIQRDKVTPSRVKHPRVGAPRRGYTLVFFAMFFFAFMALAALVIDIGFARLTQRQLDNAARAGALEGLRGAEQVDYDARRLNSRQIVEWYFDDDLDPASDDGAFDSNSGQFGAGPLASYSGDVGDPSLAAGQLLEVDPENPTYKPALIDGTPSTDGRFRVALRRGFAGEDDADLIATGPAVPYFFAYGSFMSRDRLANGIAMSGSAASRSTPVLTVGLPQPASNIEAGLQPVTLDRDFWNGLWEPNLDPSLPPTPRTVTAVISGGQILVSGTVVGQTFEIGSEDSMPLMVGRELPTPVALASSTYSGYVAVHAPISNGTNTATRVIGFGQLDAVVDANLGTVTLTPRSSVAYENASSYFGYDLSVSAGELADVLNEGAIMIESLQTPGLWSEQP